MHYQNFRPKTREENTAAFLNVMKNPVVKILGHIDNPQYDIDYDAVVKAAGENGVLLEINEASLAPYGYRGDTHADCAQILSCCRKYLVPIVVSRGSDSQQPDSEIKDAVKHTIKRTQLAEFQWNFALRKNSPRNINT